MLERLVKKSLAFLTRTYTYLSSLWAPLGLYTKIAALGIALLLILLLGYVLFSGSSAEEATETKTRAVTTKTVLELTSEKSPLALLGSVTSRNEATLLAESSGRITGVYRELGDTVSGGTVIAEIENSAQRAAVTQATGSYESAKAAYDKVAKGSVISLGSAKENSVNTLLSAYAAIDDAVSKKTDGNFSNANSQNPTFLFSSAGSQFVQQAQNNRVTMGKIIAENSVSAKTLSVNSDLISALIKTEADLRTLIAYLDGVVDALNRALADTTTTATTIAANKADATLARTTIATTLGTVTGSRQSLETQLSLQNSGDASPLQADVAAALGALKSAEGTLAAARANLEKTLIRAPFGGTINMLSAELGNFVSMGTKMATIANNGSLEIVASITEADRADLRVGLEAKINGDTTATITRIAPALDPVTKKIEVRFSVTGGTTKLTNGSSVRLLIPRETTAETTELSVPITALKITPEAPVVFTVSAENMLVAHTVTLGALRGEKVVILSGVTPDMEIVTDARGLKEGQKISLQ